MDSFEASESGPFSSEPGRIMEAMESIMSSSSRIWYRQEILLSSSDTFLAIRRQLSQAECEVGELVIFDGFWGGRTAMASESDNASRQMVAFSVAFTSGSSL